MSRYILIAPIIILSLWMYNINKLIPSIMTANVYACIELSWTKITRNVPDTTIQQYIANIIYYPLLESFHLYFNNYYLRIMSFPFNIWIYEILLGYFIIFLYEKNICWNYDISKRYVLFHGNINLKYYPVWLFCGIGFDYVTFLYQIGYTNTYLLIIISCMSGSLISSEIITYVSSRYFGYYDKVKIQ